MIELNKWISNSIAPLGAIILILYVALYFAADYLAKPVLKVINLVIIVFLLFFLGIGFYAIISASAATVSIVVDSWELLSPMAKLNYYDNKIDTLFSIFTYKMVITGILYLSIGATGILAMFFSYQLVFEIDGSWRPPLRSKIADETAKRFIDYYRKNEANLRYLNEHPKPIINQSIPNIIPEMKRENENQNLLIKSNTNKDDIEIVDNNKVKEEYGSNVPLNIPNDLNQNELQAAMVKNDDNEGGRKRILRKLKK
jgi:hypothetical protein